MADPRSALAAIRRAPVSILIAFALAGSSARADGSGQLGQTLQFHGPGAGYMIVGDASTDAGSFVVAGLPPGVVLSQAFFYCNDLAPAPAITSATLNGQPLTLQMIGSMDAQNPNLMFHAWRADVTALFTGAGTYTWSTQSGGANRGACLALFGYNPGDTDMWEVQVRDGAHGGSTADGADGTWLNPTTFGGFQASVAWPTDAELTLVVAGGEPGLQEQYLVEGSSIAGNDPATQGLDVSTYSVTSFVTPATTALQVNCNEISDAVVWMVGVLRIKVCDSCAAPFCVADGSGPVPCPCANGTPGSGCANSIFGGASMLTHGTVQPDTLALHASGVVPGALTVLFQGDAASSPAVFGDGLRCVGGRLLRMYTRFADGGGTSISPQAGEPAMGARSAALGDALVPGTTRWYQLYYRDATPGFCGPAQFNVSSGLVVPW